MTRTGVVLFTRDLRVHDQPALAAATRECDRVVPLFVLDDRLLASANRTAFLLESLADLRQSLSGGLVVRRGNAATVIERFKPDVVYLSRDVSAYAQARERRLREGFAVRSLPGVTVATPGQPAPANASHYRLFTPYWRSWRASPLPALAKARLPVRLPAGVDRGALPPPPDGAAPTLHPGGERAGRSRLSRHLCTGVGLAEPGNELDADGSSQLSPYLHLGCVSPAELARRAESAGAQELLRRLCWRDFYAQLLAARPELARTDLRPARGPWLDDPEGIAAWKEGRTGYPVVDAAMRQLRGEGFMPNRARMVAASFLTKHLLVDWRVGAAHFMEYLVNGDVASNVGNWQWVAGTGTDSRPGRFFNPALQARRHDPSGDYVRRFVPELAPLPAGRIYDPPAVDRRALGYPDPIVDHRAAVERLRALW